LTVSGFGRRRRPPFSLTVVNQALFPDVCAKAGNGFIPREICFVARGPTKQLPEKLNDSSPMPLIEPSLPKSPGPLIGPEIDHPNPAGSAERRLVSLSICVRVAIGEPQ